MRIYLVMCYSIAAIAASMTEQLAQYEEELKNKADNTTAVEKVRRTREEGWTISGDQRLGAVHRFVRGANFRVQSLGYDP